MELFNGYKTHILEEEGGLGIRSLGTVNVAMLGKQAWRLATNRKLLASKLFLSKYCMDPVELRLKGKSISNASWAARSMIRSIASL